MCGLRGILLVLLLHLDFLYFEARVVHVAFPIKTLVVALMEDY